MTSEKDECFSALKSIGIELENRINVRRSYATFDPEGIFYLDTSEVPQVAQKYLYQTQDGLVIETGVYQQPVKTWHGRPCIEISSQVGCAMRCIMCASGELKFVRDLTELELIEQVLLTKKLSGITQDNIAVSAMGTGETSLNYIHLTKALQAITAKYPGTEYRVATMGANLVALDYWAEHMPDPFQLVPSLHAATMKSRKRVIPGSHDIHKFIEAIVRFYTSRPKSQVLIKYIMMHDLNDSNADLDALLDLLYPVKDFACLQFCVLNPTPYSAANGLTRVDDNVINRWMEKLQPHFTKKMLSLYFINAHEIACGQTTLKLSQAHSERSLRG
jgi:23S rRNA (adenine2503-C2)-methyltransferase